MVEEMKKYLYQLLTKVDGLLAILITDRDGVSLIAVSKDTVPEGSIRPSFLTTFGMATDQASKLGLGNNKTLVCMYAKYQVVHINKLPLVISFIANSDSNTGHILALKDQLDPVVVDICNVQQC